MPNILVVEDDENLARGLEVNLKREGFNVVRARKGDTAVDLAVRVNPDLITLDVMLPGMSGMDVCRELRRRGVQTPVIMLTARTEEVDRILGLEIGADDYVVKPFSVRELIARIRARLRRSSEQQDSTGTVTFGSVVVDLARFSVTKNGRTVELTSKEFDIVRLLVRNRGEVVSRDRLIDEVWGGDASIGSRTVDTHVMNLRRKLEADHANPRHILSVYGQGYRFVG